MTNTSYEHLKNEAMSLNEPKRIFINSFIISIGIIGFGIYLSLRAAKEKNEFESVTGTIDYYEKTFQEINYQHKGNHRFIHISDYPIVFDIFVGKEQGDFGPKFERLDSLQLGDEITIYHAGKTPLQQHQDLRFNKTVQFIDKGDQAYFIRGNKDRLGGYLLGGFGVILIIALLLLKKAGKIR